MDRSPPGSSVHGDSPGKNMGVACHALLQGIFPARLSNLRLLLCREILFFLQGDSLPLSHQGSPYSYMVTSKYKGLGNPVVSGLDRRFPGTSSYSGSMVFGGS